MRKLVSIFACVGLALVAPLVFALAGEIYLSDSPFQPAGLKYINGGYFDGIRVDNHQSIRTMSGVQAYSWDAPMKIGSQPYSKGLMFHLVGSETVKATWKLNKRYQSLSAIIGLDNVQDVPGVFPHVVVNFIGDGKRVGTATIDDQYGKPAPTASVNVPLTGVRSLIVEVILARAQGTNIDIVNPELQ
jgi:NPCBM/NEW2 domain